MSAERPVPSARASAPRGQTGVRPGSDHRPTARLIPIVAAVALAGACERGVVRDAAVAWAPGARAVAIAREEVPCADAPCWSLWIGPTVESVQHVQTLANDEQCSEIAWTKDGLRVAFLINGHQLRLYDAERRVPAGQVTLVDASGSPSTRIARGVTFSENGRAVTFDDCPRNGSGCRAGLVGVPALQIR